VGSVRGLVREGVGARPAVPPGLLQPRAGLPEGRGPEGLPPRLRPAPGNSAGEGPGLRPRYGTALRPAPGPGPPQRRRSEARPGPGPARPGLFRPGPGA